MDQPERFDLATQHPKGEWVSKSELVAYLRCPYTFWLLATGRIQSWEALGEAGPPPPGGHERHEEVLKMAMQGLPARHRREFVLEPDIFRNLDLKILGRPDAVLSAKGALSPVLIKPKSEVSRTDELALAFYWLLLEPFREVKGLEARGYVLAWSGEPWQKIHLGPKRFDEVLATCKVIREDRQRGVNPRICSCPYCEGRPEIVQAAIEAKDLSCISGIDRRRAAKLAELGVRSYADLLAADPQLVDRQLGISARVQAGWRAHARSYEDRRPVILGGDRLELRDMLALDIEYGSHFFKKARNTVAYDSIIWLIGLCTAVGGRRKYEFLWADSPAEERRNILALLDRLERCDKVPVVTWSGRSADLPQLLKAMKRLGIRQRSRVLDTAHLDILAFLRANVRLPTPKFSLKRVAEYFGIARRSRVIDGREANDSYGAYQEARGDRKKRLKRKLLRYNRDDLKCLVEVAEKLQRLE